MSSTTLATAAPASQPGALARSVGPSIMKEALAEETEKRKLLMEFIRDNMVEGVDYGTIPGTEKKSLWKPGAEKICRLFRSTPRVKIIREIEVFADPNNPSVRPFFFYRFHCEVESNDTGAILAEGVGLCSSHESKYRYRYKDRLCPVCQKATIRNSKQEYGGGYYCNSKGGGCGTKFNKGDPQIEGQQQGKEDNPDVADVQNTVLKMGKKRSIVDAALGVSCCSDLFTQDAEDQVDDAPKPADKPKPGSRANKEKSARNRELATKDMNEAKAAGNVERLKGIWSEVSKLWNGGNGDGFTEEDFNALVKLKDEVKAAMAQQPPPEQKQGGSAAETVRAGIMAEFKRRAEVLEKDYRQDVNVWLSSKVHDGLTLAALEDPKAWPTQQVVEILGQMNAWMEQTIPF